MISVYLKPLIKDIKTNFAKAMLGRLKYNISRAGLKYINESIRKSFGGKGSSIRKGTYYTIGRNSVTFHLSSVGVFHNFGVRQHKMRYLTKAKRPIPIKLKTGELIFRKASAKSMARAKSWTHPGIKPKRFLENGIKKLKKEFRDKIKNESLKYFRGK